MRALRGVVLLTVLLLATSLAADSIQPPEPLRFQSLNQSIWGPGGSATMDYKVDLIDSNVAKWDESLSERDVRSFVGASFGGGISGSTTGRIGLWLDLKMQDLGSVDVKYPVTPRIDFPDANSFRAGDTVTVTTSYVLDDIGWEMETTSPQFTLELDGTFAASAQASAEICVFGCGSVTLLPSISHNAGEFNIFTLRPGSTIEKPGYVDFGPDATVTIPDIQTSATLDGRSLTGNGSDDFLALSIDLAAIAFDAAGSPVDPSFDSADYGSYAVNVRAWYTILKVEPTLTLQARQNFRFDPNLKVNLQFAKTLEYRIGTSGDFLTGNSVLVTVGDSVQVRYPSDDKQPTAIDPTFRLDNTFHSVTGLQLAKSIKVEAAGAGLEVPSVEIIPEICFGFLGCTPSLDSPSFDVSVNPLYDRDFSLGSPTRLPDLYNHSWQLEGFTPITVTAFSLDPENPIVTIDQQTGATRNLGGGRRQVAYAIDFANGGDVKLSDVHLQTDLAAAFAAAHSYKVDQVIGCDVATNPDFNGGTDKELLASGTSLDVGAKARVILIVSVYPRPDPPVYTLTSVDDGTSQLGTLVTQTDSSDVLLGSGIITSADDYVLFGEQFVKLDAIANTFGHVGSNDFVEVKNGLSGIVAGDLRAGRVVRVQGSITADYAFAGSIVDVVGKGRLTLSGNVKQGVSVPAYTLAAIAPATPLVGNVWVGDNQSQLLQPGHYGDVTVNANAALMLEPGTYSFHKLSVANGALVQVIGSTRNGIINIVDPGEVRIGQGATVRATLYAPRTNVTFEERSRLEGAASAKSITLRPGASASYHFDCDRLVDPDCDGSANCGTL